jgi:hypothetical protein
MPGVVTGGVSGTLPAGEYVLVVDNSGAGPSRPGGSTVTAVVDLTVTASDGGERARVGTNPSSR